jgi:hypothetical protein
VGFSIGIAIVGTLLTSRTIAGAISRVNAQGSLSPALKAQSVEIIRRSGVTFTPPVGTSKVDATLLHRLFVDALASGARVPLIFGGVVVTIALAISMLLPDPRVVNVGRSADEIAEVELMAEAEVGI